MLWKDRRWHLSDSRTITTNRWQRESWVSESTLGVTAGLGLPVFSKQVFSDRIICHWCVCGGAGGVLWDFPRDTCQQTHHSDLLCTGLPLSTFTPLRDNARPKGTWGPSHRDSRASICGFLLLLQELNRPMDAPAESSLQAAALSSPAVSVHHPTGPGLYGRLQQVCGRTSKCWT